MKIHTIIAATAVSLTFAAQAMGQAVLRPHTPNAGDLRETPPGDDACVKARRCLKSMLPGATIDSLSCEQAMRLARSLGCFEDEPIPAERKKGDATRPVNGGPVDEQGNPLWGREERRPRKANDAAATDRESAAAEAQQTLEEILSVYGITSPKESGPPSDESFADTHAGGVNDGAGQSEIEGYFGPLITGAFNHTSAYGFTAGAVQPADHVYSPVGTTPPDGLSVVAGYDLQNGFKANVYEGHFQGQPVVYVAFAGTDPNSAADIMTNVQATTGPGIPSQYQMAAELAAQVQSQYPGNDVVLTGHSLGGGLAAYASDVTGLPAISYNGFGSKHVIEAGAYQRGDRSSRVTHVNSDGDWLTRAGGDVVGKPWSADVKVGPKGGHGIAPIRDQIESGTVLTPKKPTSAPAPKGWYDLVPRSGYR